MKSYVLIVFLCLSFVDFAQINEKAYIILVNQADSLYKVKQYEKSAYAYSAAFKELGWKGRVEDRYNAACSWAMAGKPDSAFFNLERIANVTAYKDYNRITLDSNLNSLHGDRRWEKLIKLIKDNKDKYELNLNKPLVQQLDSILNDDQKYRLQLEEIEGKYGRNSKEMQALGKKINQKDSVNLKKVLLILDKYGWLGPDEIGEPGNAALFLVIQHSDHETREKYLPIMKEAVKRGKARGSDLALLEDRVALAQGKKQIYGSQIGGNSGSYYVLPLEDPDNVDTRRAEVGLQPLAEYLKHWKIKWDVEEYKKTQKK